MTDRPDERIDSERRRLLTAAGRGGVALAAGVMLMLVPAPVSVVAAAATAGASNKVRWGLLIDTGKCADGCDVCVSACRTENGWGGGGNLETDPQWIRTVAVKNPNGGAQVSVPVMCQHCAEPPCVDVCPTGASFKRADGIVLVDKHTCIGCRYCMMACPYKARSFVHEAVTDQKPYAPRGQGTVEGCTFCVHRLDAGGTPACVEACGANAGGAMMFGDLNDPDSAIAREVTRLVTTRIRADLGLDPGVHYRGI